MTIQVNYLLSFFGDVPFILDVINPKDCVVTCFQICLIMFCLKHCVANRPFYLMQKKCTCIVKKINKKNTTFVQLTKYTAYI